MPGFRHLRAAALAECGWPEFAEMRCRSGLLGSAGMGALSDLFAQNNKALVAMATFLLPLLNRATNLSAIKTLGLNPQICC